MSFLCRALLSVLLMRNRLAEQHRAFSDWAGENFLAHSWQRPSAVPTLYLTQPFSSQTPALTSFSMLKF